MSTGTNDPLLASVIAIENDEATCVFISLDVIFVDKALTRRVRDRIAGTTGIRPESILLSATHTHSGPVTVGYVSNECDPIVPRPNERYLSQLEDHIVTATTAAWTTRRSAEAACVVADATGIGTNRHDPRGISDLEVPVVAFRDSSTSQFIAVLAVCAMHPTVLHEDSTVFSGDFPAFARQYLQRELVGHACTIAYHTGASGDQSPRHVTRGNTIAEAERLGEILGKAIASSLADAKYDREIALCTARTEVIVPLREPPTRADAEQLLRDTTQRFEHLKQSKASAATVRSAECDIFGAEEMLALAKAGEEDRLRIWLDTISPAEVQVLRVGGHTFVGWPGEFFIEFALALREQFPRTRFITLANGELQGYVVTQEAVDRHWYEAGNALLKSPDAGRLIVDATAQLLDSIGEARSSSRS